MTSALLVLSVLIGSTWEPTSYNIIYPKPSLRSLVTSQWRRNDVIKLANQIFEGKRWISICVLWNSEVVKWQGVKWRGVKWRGAKRRWGVKWRQGVKWRVMRNAAKNRQKIWFNLQVLIPYGLASLYGVCVAQMLDPILQKTNCWYCSKIKFQMLSVTTGARC